MDPAAYLDEVRTPLLGLLFDYCAATGYVSRDEFVREVDVRRLLRRLLDRMQELIAAEADSSRRRRISQERRALSYLTDIFNSHAHDHELDTRNLALATASCLAIFTKHVNLEKSSSAKRILSLNERMFAALFSEYAPQGSQRRSSEDLDLQIEALHDKIDRLLSVSAGSPADIPQISTSVKSLSGRRRKLEQLRSAIEAVARQRGRQMDAWQHLLQMRHLDDLLEKSPKSVEDLREWAEKLPSYQQNKVWIDRQIDRWGGEIVGVLARKFHRGLADVAQSVEAA